jgi:hypothetical protein
VDLHHFYSKGKINATILSKATRSLFKHCFHGHCFNSVIRGHCCEPTIIPVPIVSTMCSYNDFSFHSLQQYVPTVPSVSCVSRSCFNNCLGCHCCNCVPTMTLVSFVLTMFQQRPRLTFMQQCVPTMTLGHGVAAFVEKRNRQTGRHGLAHKMFFSHARVQTC